MSIGSVVSFPRVGHGVGQKFLANPQSNFLQQKIPENRGFLGFLSCVDEKDAALSGAQHSGAARLRHTSVFAAGETLAQAESTSAEHLKYQKENAPPAAGT